MRRHQAPVTSTSRQARLQTLCLLLGASLLCLPLASVAADAHAVGQRIFREGILPNGKPMTGLGQAGVTSSGAVAACATCHRRSGFGSSEGPVEVRAITGPALFGERVATAAPGSLGINANVDVQVVHELDQADAKAAAQARARSRELAQARAQIFSGQRQRPVYDNAALARAIRSGIDITGRKMDASMPRYELDDGSMASLTAYLRTLSMDSAPGITADAVQVAIVVQPGVSAARRQAVVRVIEQLFNDINAGQKDAVNRERAGQAPLGRTFRPWRLHVWELQGARSTWESQLDTFYREQPVFAMVSGLGDASWAPIHEFAERNEIPCIFPQTQVPKIDEHDFYTVYLNRGVVLEAQALARYLRGQSDQGRIVQLIARGDDASITASDAFRAAWSGGSGDRVRDVGLPPVADEKFWRDLSREHTGARFVLWLRPGQLANASMLTSPDSGVRAVYLSSGMGSAAQSAIKADAAGRLRLIWPEDLPAARRARLDQIRRWMRAKGIEVTDAEAQYNAYLAATVMGMVAMHTKDAWSREMLIERMEHRVGTALELSMYPRITLGPGQRFASKGSYIVQLNADPANPMTALSDWIVP